MTDRRDEETMLRVGETFSFSQVVFTDVPPSYTTNTAVTCRYTVTDGLQTSPRDWIGIFKVGWQLTQEYYSYVYVQLCQDQARLDPHKQEVVFKENTLPKDDGEFYQFCYVNSCGHVRGASLPFRFQNPAGSNPDCSLEKDLTVVTTQEQAEMLEKEKEGFVKEIESLNESNTIIKNELDERLHEICRLKKCLDDLKSKDKLKTPRSEVQEGHVTKQSLTSLRENYETLVQNINMLKQERTELQEQIEWQFTEKLELNMFLTETEHNYTELQDRVRLLEVDVQSSRKDNEKLRAEIVELLKVKKTLEEQRVLQASMSQLAGRDDHAHVQINALLTQLTETRDLLCREMQKCKAAKKRTESAEQELKEVRKKQVEINEAESERNSQIKAKLYQTQDKIFEMAETSRLDEQKLTEKNEELQEEVDRLRKTLFDQMASVAAVSEQLPSPQRPPASSNTRTHAPHYHIYENIDMTGDPSRTENTMRVCRHCQESFPGISEDELGEHELSHKVCPFCTLLCDDWKQQQFEDHVYGHE